MCITLCVVKLVQTIGIYTRLAQLVERWPLKPVVVGSSPTGGVCFFASLRSSVATRGRAVYACSSLTTLEDDGQH